MVAADVPGRALRDSHAAAIDPLAAEGLIKSVDSSRAFLSTLLTACGCVSTFRDLKRQFAASTSFRRAALHDMLLAAIYTWPQLGMDDVLRSAVRPWLRLNMEHSPS